MNAMPQLPSRYALILDPTAIRKALKKVESLNLPRRECRPLDRYTGPKASLDLARFDDDGFLFIEGRLSRFSKIGGEMVPHLTIEAAVNESLGAAEGELLAVVTAVPDASKGERLIVFHLPTDRDPRDIVKGLQQRGLPNLWVPAADSFAEIAEMPMLGSGKLDLRRLGDMARERFVAGGAT